MTIRILTGDCRDVLPTLEANSVHCVVTSPPYYGLRDYGTAQWDGGDAGCDHKQKPEKRGNASYTNGQGGSFASNLQAWGDRDVSSNYRITCGKCGARRIDRQIGLEATPDEYIQTMVEVFRELRRVLRDDGTVWCNMGDSFSSKQLLMMPARLALALQADGWWLRSDIIWAKPNPMPESVTDRPTNAHEYVFLLTKRSRYFYDAEAVREDAEYGRRDLVGATLWGRVRDADPRDDRKGCTGYVTGKHPETGRNLRNVWTIATAPFSEWTPQYEITQIPASEAQAPGAKGNARGGDTARITSPDCPLHAGQPDRVPTGFYDGLSGAQLSRINGNAGPAQDMPAGSSTIQHIPAQSRSLPSTGDCSDHEGAETATPHSTESHRTALGPLFSEHAIFYEETADGRPRIPPSRYSPALTDRDTAESRSGDGSEASSCELETAADSSRMSASGSSGACRCGYYRKVTTRTSHFATFPPELAERCIKAGTSERGCCAQCGKPWVRETERTAMVIDRSERTHPMGRTRASGTMLEPPTSTTTGWSPGCQCNAEVAPCVVLDPFSGAGTSGLVADRLGRDAVMIDLNHQYVEMARERLQRDCPLFADITDAPVPEPPEDERMVDLFAEVAD